jgi:hypothetical protein
VRSSTKDDRRGQRAGAQQQRQFRDSGRAVEAGDAELRAQRRLDDVARLMIFFSS